MFDAQKAIDALLIRARQLEEMVDQGAAARTLRDVAYALMQGLA